MIFAECYDLSVRFRNGHGAVPTYEHLKNQVDMPMFP
jgi:hypothetical protein